MYCKFAVRRSHKKLITVNEPYSPFEVNQTFAGTEKLAITLDKPQDSITKGIEISFFSFNICPFYYL